MLTMPLYFELPDNLTAKKLIDKLSKKYSLHFISQHYTFKTFYDSFDWRLYQADLLCELQQSQHESVLRLQQRKTGKSLIELAMDNAPVFASDITDKPLRKQLAALLEMRALLPITTLDFQVSRWVILNKKDLPVLHLKLEAYSEFKQRLLLEPVARYGKIAKEAVGFLTQSLALAPANQPVLVSALKSQGRKPADYSSKFTLSLEPSQPADKAIRTIFKQLLIAIKRNEPGTIDALDSEFLHDFRVAVRRMRTALGQFKALMPKKIGSEQRAFFAWLGQITSTPRDLDVYLLNFPSYQASLPKKMRPALEPLQVLLQQKQRLAQKELAQHLTSPRYLSQLIAWEDYLTQNKLPASTKSIKTVADKKIWRTFQQVLGQGQNITESSDPVSLHDLRKTCKKLRYLLEFFQSLYPADDMKILIAALKGFQEVLGDFQDYEVQELTLREFSQQMRQDGVAEATFVAMETLIATLETKRCQARADFAERFADFSAEDKRKIFTQLFAHNSVAE